KNFKTNLNDFDVENITDDFFFIKNQSIFSGGIYVLIDDIPYEYSSRETKYTFNYSYNTICFVRFKTGQLDISANRESIQYTDKTIKKISTKLDAVADKIIENVKIKLSEAKTYPEAVKLLLNTHSEQADFLKFNKIPYEWNGYPVKNNWQFKTIKIRQVFEDWDNKTSKDAIVPYKYKTEKPLYFVKGYLNRSKSKTLLDNSDSFYVIDVPRELRNFHKKTFTDKKQILKQHSFIINEYKKDIEKLNAYNLNVVDFDAVKQTKVKSSMKKENDEILVKGVIESKRFDVEYSIKQRYIHRSKLNSNMVYIIAKNSEIPQLSDTIIEMRRYGCIFNNYFFYIISKKYYEDVKDVCTDFDTFKKNIKEELKIKKTVRHIERNIDERYINLKKHFSDDIICAFNIIDDFMKENKQNYIHYEVSKIDVNIDAGVASACETIKKIDEKYPLLQCLGYSVDEKDVIHYINLINKELVCQQQSKMKLVG
ncbi:MAG: hypothetical protein ACOC2U_00915, partial [bacterium]